MSLVKIDLSHLKESVNPVYYPLLWNDKRYLLLKGGRGSGKSHFASEKIITRIGFSYIGKYQEKFIVCRKTQPELRKSCFALLNKYINQWGMKKLVDINKHEMTFTFDNGSQILCIGLDDPEKLKSIEGVTSVWIEELTGISLTDFTEIDLILRGITPSYKQIIMTFNPVFSWVKDYFFDREINYKNTIICETTYKDNRFLGDSFYGERLEKLKDEDEDLYQIYTLGKWAKIGNIIYKNWEVKEISTYDADYDQVLNGLDFGWNHPTALLRVGVKNDDLYIFDELYKSELSIPDLIKMVKTRVKNQVITADSARPEFIKEMSDAGIWIKGAIKGPGSVIAGIEWVRRRKLYIHPRCINTIKEIQCYKYKEDKRTGTVFEEPVKFMDDAMAALRYAVEDSVGYEVLTASIDPETNPVFVRKPGIRPDHILSSRIGRFGNQKRLSIGRQKYGRH